MAKQVDHSAVKRGVATLAALAAGASPMAAHASPDPTATSSYRILANPTGGDDFLFRNGIHDNAQQMSNRLFAALQAALGGGAPQLNFAANGDPSVTSDGHFSASPATNTINLDPLAVEAFTNSNSVVHNPAVSDMPHEMAHLRQTSDVLANLVQREGGAQAFADLTSNVAAGKAGIPFRPGNYDANYADYVQQVQQLGNNWILGTQFGHAPVKFP